MLYILYSLHHYKNKVEPSRELSENSENFVAEIV